MYSFTPCFNERLKRETFFFLPIKMHTLVCVVWGGLFFLPCSCSSSEEWQGRNREKGGRTGRGRGIPWVPAVLEQPAHRAVRWEQTTPRACCEFVFVTFSSSVEHLHSVMLGGQWQVPFVPFSPCSPQPPGQLLLQPGLLPVQRSDFFFFLSQRVISLHGILTRSFT